MKKSIDIKKRLEWITKRLKRIEDKIYQLDESKDEYSIKKFSWEKSGLLVEKKRLLDRLKEWCTASIKN